VQSLRLLKKLVWCSGNQSLSLVGESCQGIFPSVKLPANHLREILQVQMKGPFKRLLLETLLWQFTMNATHKCLPKGLKDLECERGKLTSRPLSHMSLLSTYTRRETTHKSRLSYQMGQIFRCLPLAKGKQRIPCTCHCHQASPRTERDVPRHWENAWDYLRSQEAVRTTP
jgi:hypothetical protein